MTPLTTSQIDCPVQSLHRRRNWMLVPVERQQKVNHARRAAAELGKVALKEAATTHCPLVSHIRIILYSMAIFDLSLIPRPHAPPTKK